MAESTGIFTFQETEPKVDEIPYPSPSQLVLNEFDQSYLNFDDHRYQELDDIDPFDAEDLLSDPIVWQFCNGQDGVAGNSEADGGTEIPEQGHGMNPEFDDPVFKNNSLCACCQILRGITHINGMNVKRLEIHGAFGVITHAVLGVYDYGLSCQAQDSQMFDFHKESIQTVKNFLVQYYEVCRQEGYMPMQDPLSTFYEALSVGFNEPNFTNDFLQFTPQFAGGSNQVGLMKIPLAMQRERTRNLQLKDFVDYFDLPIGDAARKLNVCPTVMKKICRKHGVLRWPYRKIKSIERKISKAKKMLDASADDERARAQDDLQKYKLQLENIYAKFSH